MKEILEKELIIQISGTVENSNIDEFEKEAETVLGSINKVLVTDEHFAEAKQNIKDCQLAENRIYNAHQGALAKAGPIFDVINKAERVQLRFRGVRLDLNRTVKSEEAKRKREIVEKGKVTVVEEQRESPVGDMFKPDFGAFDSAIKGKRSLTSMEEAMKEVADNTIERLRDFELNHKWNMATIDGYEEEFPGLFPDKREISTRPPETVDALIKSRVAEFKLKQIEKERREAGEKERAEQEKAKPAPGIIDPVGATDTVSVEMSRGSLDIPPPPLCVPEGIETATIYLTVVAEDIDDIIEDLDGLPGILRITK
jgi:hypothetical protein